MCCKQCLNECLSNTNSFETFFFSIIFKGVSYFVPYMEEIFLTLTTLSESPTLRSNSHMFGHQLERMSYLVKLLYTGNICHIGCCHCWWKNELHLLKTSMWIFKNIVLYNKYHGQSKRYNWHLANVSITTVIETFARCQLYHLLWPWYLL